MYPQYMCFQLYVIVIQCNGISEMYSQFGMQMYPQYMCIVLY